MAYSRRSSDDDREYVLMPVRSVAGDGDEFGGRSRHDSDCHHSPIRANNFLEVPPTRRGAAGDRGVSPTIVNIASTPGQERRYRGRRSPSSSSSSRSRSRRHKRGKRGGRSRSRIRSRGRNSQPPVGTTVIIAGPPSARRDGRSRSRTRFHRRDRSRNPQLLDEKNSSYYVTGALEYERELRRDNPDKALLHLAINGLYWKVHSLERSAMLKYHAVDWSINVLLIAQVSLSTVLVALGATGNQYQKGIIILGAFFPVITGVLALIKGQGFPGRIYHHARGLRKLAEEIERLKRIIASGGSAIREDCESLYVMYDEIQKDYDADSLNIWRVKTSPSPQTAPEQPGNLQVRIESEEVRHLEREGKE